MNYLLIILFMITIIAIFVFVSKENYTNIKYSYIANPTEKYNITDLTNVENDQCSMHHDNRIIPQELSRCDIRFNNKGNNLNVNKHNKGEICLSACTYNYKDRIDILYKRGLLPFPSERGLG